MSLIGNVWSVGRASLRCTPRPLTCTSATAPVTLTGVIRPSRTRYAPTNQGWGLVEDPGSLFGPTIVRWYPVVQWFDGAGFADLLRSTSLYRRLEPEVREPLLNAIAERIRARMGDRAPRRYLAVLRVGQRAD